VPADDDDEAIVLAADSDEVRAVRLDDVDDDDAIISRAPGHLRCRVLFPGWWQRQFSTR